MAAWIYKKTDSVFRGHVAAEIEALMEPLSKRSALLVPANPSMGRKISDGIYTVNDIPLSETPFTDDPESSVRSSNAVELLNAPEHMPVASRTLAEGPAESGITIGNVSTVEALHAWAELAGENMLVAGGSDFFASLLQARGYRRRAPGNVALRALKRGKTLILKGARNQESPGVSQGGNHSSLVFPVHSEADLDSSHRQEWTEAIRSALRRYRVVVVGYQCAVKSTPGFNKALSGFTARLVSDTTESVGLSHLMIEGGTTASTVVRTMNRHVWTPVQCIRPGTVSLREKGSGLVLTVKPGSYPWPPAVRSLIQSSQP